MAMGDGPMQPLGPPTAAAFLSGTDRQAAGVLGSPKEEVTVMRTLSAVLAVAVAVAVWAAPPAVQAKAEQKVVVLVERIQDLNLTDAQEAKIADIRKEYRPKIQEAAKEVAGVVKEEV